MRRQAALDQRNGLAQDGSVAGKDAVEVNCKVCLIKGITEANENNSKLWEKILLLDNSNKIFKNKTLQMIIHYKWDSYGKQKFFLESCVFAFFFLLFLINSTHRPSITLVWKVF